MVAVVTGSGLGLFNSNVNNSTVNTGIQNQSKLGQSNAQAYVNTATGNLILQYGDKDLSGVGQDLSYLRTYNSKGQISSGDGSWSWGNQRKVLLVTGTNGAIGSQVSRVDVDGHSTVYTWDSASNSYASSEGAGAHDRIVWDNANNQWLWTEGSSQLVERYAGQTGLLASVTDKTGQTISYTYDANGRLTSIKDVNVDSGQEFLFTYNADGLLTTLSTKTKDSSNPVKQVYYSYDNLKRLSQVKTDLSLDNAISDNNVYITTYEYDGDSHRISKVSQNDGRFVSFSYKIEVVNDVNEYRIESVTDELGVTTYSYDIVKKQTDVSRGGQTWSYFYDASGQLLEVRSPDVNNIRESVLYRYDDKGNLTRITQHNGSYISYSYDTNGNVLLEQDNSGNTIARTYNSTNQLLTETRYTDIATTTYTPIFEQDFSQGIAGFAPNSSSPHVPSLDSPVSRIDGKLVFSRVSNSTTDTMPYLLETNTRSQNIDSLYRISVNTGVISASRYWRAELFGSGVTGAKQNGLVFEGTAIKAFYPNNINSTVSVIIGTLKDNTDYIVELEVEADRLAYYIYEAGQTRTQGISFSKAVRGDRIQLRMFSKAGTSTYEASAKVSVDDVTVLQKTTAQAGSTTAAQTSRYVYDSLQRLIYSVSETGGVTKYEYNAQGLLSKQSQYTQEKYTKSIPTTYVGDGLNTYLTTELNTWVTANAANKTQVQLIEYSYDYRGNLQSQTRYAVTDATTGMGNKLTDNAAEVIEYSYNAYGQLLQQIEVRGANRDIKQGFSSYSYDGLGRVLSEMNGQGVKSYDYKNGTIANQNIPSIVSHVQISEKSDNNNNTGTIKGKVTLQGYDQVGRLIYVMEKSNDNLSQRTTNYVYDSTGHLRMVEDPTGVRSYIFYDEQDRVKARVDGTGAVTEYSYNSQDQITQERYIATVQATSTWYDAATNQVTYNYSSPASNSADRFIRYTYDITGLLSRKVDVSGVITDYQYDGRNQLISSIVRGNVADQTASPDRVTRYFYDAAGRQQGQLDAEGYLTETLYDAAGRVFCVRRYVNLTVASLRASGSLEVLRGSLGKALDPSKTNDLTALYTFNFYDGLGRITGVRDEKGFITEYIYDEVNNRQQTLRYLKYSTLSISGTTTFNALKDDVRSTLTDIEKANTWFASSLAGKVDVQSQQFDAYGRLQSQTNPEGTTTEYQYDLFGRVIRQVTAKDSAEERATRTRYDDFHQVIGQVSGDKEKSFNPTATSANQAAFIRQFGVTYKYDLSGRKIQQEDNTGLITYFYYDKAGRLTHQINGLGEVVEFEYNRFGEMVKKTQYEKRLTDGSNDQGLVLPEGVGVKTLSISSVIAGASSVYWKIPTPVAGETLTANVWFKAAVDTKARLALAGVSQELLGNGQWQQLSISYKVPDTYTTGDILVYLLSNSNNTSLQQEGQFVLFDNLMVSSTQVGREAILTKDFDSGVHGGVMSSNSVVQVINGTGQISLKGGLVTNELTALIQGIRQSSKDNQQVWAYNTKGQVTSKTDGEGFRQDYTYNVYGEQDTLTQLLKKAEGATAAVTATTRYDYNKRGQQIGITEDVGGLSLFSKTDYDAFGRVIRQTDALQKLTTTSYSYGGREIVVTDPLSHVRKTEYDALDRVVKVTDALGAVTSYSYDSTTRKMMVTSAEGVTVTTEKSRYGETLRVTDGKGQITQYSYNRSGQLLSVTDALGNVTKQQRYDKANQLIESVDANNGRVQYSYDLAGRVLKKTVIGTINQVTSYEFDGMGRQVKVTEGEGTTQTRITTYEYDKTGRVFTETVDPAGQGLVTTYRYDGSGQAIKVSTGTVGNTEQRVVSYEYDKAGRRIKETVDPAGSAISTQYRYDNEDRVSRKIDALGNSTWYAYDSAGLLRFTVDALGSVTRQDYDNNNRVIAKIKYNGVIASSVISSWGDTVALNTLNDNTLFRIDNSRDQATFYDYDKDGRQRYEVDSLGRVTESRYDATGNVVQQIRHETPVKADTLIWQNDLSANPNPAIQTTAQSNLIATALNTYPSIFGYQDGQLLLRNPLRPSTADISASVYTELKPFTEGLSYELDIRFPNIGQTMPKEFMIILDNGLSSSGDRPLSLYRYNGIYFKNGTFYARSYRNSVEEIALTAAVAGASYHIRLETQLGGVTVVLSQYAADGQTVVNEWSSTLTGADWQNAKMTLISYSRAGYDDGVAYVDNIQASKRNNTQAYQGTTNYTVYDSNNRPRYQIDALQRVIETRYDAMGRATETIKHNQPLTVDLTTLALTESTLNALVYPDPTQPLQLVAKSPMEPDTADQRIRYVYDTVGRVRFTVGADNRVTETRYNVLSQVIETIRHTAVLANTVAMTEEGIAEVLYSLERMDFEGVSANTANTSLSLGVITTNSDIFALDNTRLILKNLKAASSDVALLGSSSTTSVGTVYKSELTLSSALPLNMLFGLENVSAGGQQRRHLVQIKDGQFNVVRGLDTGESIETINNNVVKATINTSYVVEVEITTTGTVLYLYEKGKTREQGFSNYLEGSNWSTARFYFKTYRSSAYPDTPVEAYVDNLVKYQLSGTPAADSIRERVVYNNLGQARYRIDALGYVTENSYDALGQVIEERRYSNSLKVAIPTTLTETWVSSEIAKVNTTPSTIQKEQSVYNAQGLLRFSIDSLGYVTEYRYNGVGQVTDTLKHTLVISGGTEASIKLALYGTNNTLPSTSQQTHYVYNNKGLLRYTIDALGYVTENRYNGLGQVIETITHPSKITVLGNEVDTSTAVYGSATGTTPSALAKRTRMVYDRLGQVRYVIDSLNVVVEKRYDSLGRLTKETKYPFGITIPSTLSEVTVAVAIETAKNLAANAGAISSEKDYSYDVYNRVQEEVSATSQRVKNNILETGRSVTRYGYDAFDRIVAKTEGIFRTSTGDDITEVRTTRYVYDLKNQLRYTVDALGYVTENKYDAFGQVVDTVKFDKKINLDLIKADGDVSILTSLLSSNVTLSNLDTVVKLDNGQLRVTQKYQTTTQEFPIFLEKAATPFVTGARYQVTFKIDDLASNHYLGLWVKNTSGQTLGIKVSENKLYTTYGGTALVNGFSFSAQKSYVFEVEKLAVGCVLYVYEKGTDRGLGYNYQLDSSGWETVSFSAFGRTQTAQQPSILSSISIEDIKVPSQDSTTTNTNQRTRYVYDTKGQLRYTVDALGYVTENKYDALGQVVETLKFASTTEATTESGIRSAYYGTGTTPPSTAQRTRYIYDTKGQLRYTVDALGYATENKYDALGQVVETIKFDKKINVAYANSENDVNFMLSLANSDLSVNTLEEGVTLNNNQFAVTQIYGTATQTWPSFLNGAFKTHAVGNYYQLDFKLNDLYLNYYLGLNVVKADGDTYGIKMTDGKFYRSSGVNGTNLTEKPIALVPQKTYVFKMELTDAGWTVNVTEKGTNISIYSDTLGAVGWENVSFSAFTRTQKNAKPSTALPRVMVDNISVVGNSATIDNSQRTRYIYDSKGQLRYTVDALGYVSENKYDALGQVVETVKFDKKINVAYANSENDVNFMLSLANSDLSVNTLEEGVTLNNNQFAVTQIYGTATQTWPSFLNGAFKTHAVGNYYQLDFKLNDLYLNYYLGLNVVKADGDTYGIKMTDGKFYRSSGVNGTNLTEKPIALVPQKTYVFKMELTDAGWTVNVTEKGTNISIYSDTLGAVGWENVSFSAFTRTQKNAKPSTALPRVMVDNISVMGNSADNSQRTRYVYDTKGQLRYTVDALGYTTENIYNALGQVVETLKFATTTIATTESGIKSAYYDSGTTPPSTAQRTRYFYDTKGQLRYSVDALGYVTEQNYNAAGLVEQKTAYAKPSTTLTVSSLSEVKSLVDNTIKDISKDQITTYVYDKLGQELRQTDSNNNSIVKTYDAFGNVSTVTDQLGNKGYFYYDALNRNTLHIDPENYLQQNIYDDLGRLTNTIKYANKVQGTLNPSIPPVVSTTAVTGKPYVISNANSDQITTYDYDALNRQIQITNAENYLEKFEYDAFGNKVGYYDKGNSYFSYKYDLLGRLVEETLPITSSQSETLSKPVVNRYEYDAYGNLKQKIEAYQLKEQRITNFEYDSLNRLTKKYGESIQIYIVGSSYILKDSTPTIEYSYDAFGNILLTTNNGNKTFSWYNKNNQKIYEQNAVGYISYWDYDYAGHIIKQMLFSDIKSLPTKIESAIPVIAENSKTRVTEYLYNRAGQLYSTVIKNVQIYDQVLDKYDLFNSVNITSYQYYDASGNMIRQVDGRGNTTYVFYDKIGRKTLSVDAAGYATKWTYEVKRTLEKRYAIKPNISIDVNTTFAQINSALVSDSENDRSTYTEFDRLGRVLATEILNVKYGIAYDSNIVPEKSDGKARTDFVYNALDKVTQQKNANGSITKIEYDALGREILRQGADFRYFLDNQPYVSQRSQIKYDGLGQVIEQRLLDRDDTNSTGDRISRFEYNKAGQQIAEYDALGNKTLYFYDANGNKTVMAQARTDANNSLGVDLTFIQYNALNKETKRLVIQGTFVTPPTTEAQKANLKQNLMWADIAKSGSTIETTELDYNAFGEIKAKRLNGSGANGTWQEQMDYNNLGKVWKTNAQGGVTKYFVYDRNGNATLQLDTIGEFNQITDVNQLSQINNVTYTETHYDERNLVTDVIQPEFNTSTNTTALNLFNQVVTGNHGYFDQGSVTAINDKGEKRTSPLAAQGGLVEATYFSNTNLTVKLEGQYQGVVQNSQTKWGTQKVSGYQKFYVNKITLDLPRLQGYGDGDYLAQLITGDNTYSSALTNSGTKIITIDNINCVLTGDYRIRLVKYVNGVEYVISEEVKSAPTNTVWSQIYYANQPNFGATTGSVVTIGAGTVQQSISSITLKELHIKDLPTETTDVELQYRVKGTSGWATVNASQKYIGSQKQVGWYSVSLDTLNASDYEYQYVAYNSNDEAILRSKGDLVWQINNTLVSQTLFDDTTIQIPSYNLGNINQDIKLLTTGTSGKNISTSYTSSYYTTQFRASPIKYNYSISLSISIPIGILTPIAPELINVSVNGDIVINDNYTLNYNEDNLTININRSFITQNKNGNLELNISAKKDGNTFTLANILLPKTESSATRIPQGRFSPLKYLISKNYTNSSELDYLHIKGLPSTTQELRLLRRPKNSTGNYGFNQIFQPFKDSNGNVVENGWYAIPLSYFNEGETEFILMAFDQNGDVISRQQGFVNYYTTVTTNHVDVDVNSLPTNSDGFATVRHDPSNNAMGFVNFWDVSINTYNGTRGTLELYKNGIKAKDTVYLTASTGGLEWRVDTSIGGDFPTTYDYVLTVQDSQGNVTNKIIGQVDVGKWGSSDVSIKSYIPAYSLPTKIKIDAGNTNVSKVILKYGKSLDSLQSIELNATNGVAVWDALNVILANGMIPQNYFYQFEAKDANGVVLNAGSGTVDLGINGGRVSFEHSQRPNWVDIKPSATTGTRMELYYRVRQSDNLGQRSDLEDWSTATVFSQQTLNSTNGNFRWDTSQLAGNAYEYFYKLYDVNDNLLTQSTGEVDLTTGTAKEKHWQIGGGINQTQQIHRQQSYNAFGEVISETDGNQNTTTLSYNTLGKLIKRTQAETDVTYENGYTQRVTPITRYIYDLTGRLIAHIDPNAYLNNQISTIYRYSNAINLETGESIIAETRNLEGAGTYSIDANRIDEFGQIRSVSMGLSSLTQQNYDKNGNLIEIIRPSSVKETWQYDEQGNRISHTVSGKLNQQLTQGSLTDKTFYDSLGRVIKTVTAANIVTSINYTWSSSIVGLANNVIGGYIKTTTTEGVSTEQQVSTNILKDYIEYFGRTVKHLDLSGREFNYTYDIGGHLVNQTSTNGQNISYDYYSNGYLKEIRDAALNKLTRYSYDDNGNRTNEVYMELNESSTNSQQIYQNPTIHYDELNRIESIDDARFNISYKYDANGNVRQIYAIYHDGVNGNRKVQDYWYKYDTRNRFTVSMGTLIGDRSVITTKDDTRVTIGTGDTGVALTYNNASQRKTATYGKNALGNNDGLSHTESYQYTSDGYLETVQIDNVLKNRRVYDALNRVVINKDYSDGVTLVKEQKNTYLNDTRIKTQAVIENGSTLTTDFSYYEEGSLHKTIQTGGPTNTTMTYEYEWWDAAKQKKITIQAQNSSAPGWRPGWTSFEYDKNGHLAGLADLQHQDVNQRRRMDYVTNSEGLILQRHEFVGGNQSFLRYRDFFYVDGKRVGDISNDGPSRENYAQSIAGIGQNNDRYKNWKPISSADFDQNYEPISPDYPGRTPTSYTARVGDNLRTVALSVWGDEAMWYLIADANGLDGTEVLKDGQVLVIPNKVSNIHHNIKTFRPYNAGEAIGDTQPTLPNAPPPPQPKKKCGGLAQVIMVIVAVVATVLTAGAASVALSSTASFASGAGLGAAASAGTAALAGGAAAGAIAGVSGAIGAFAAMGGAMIGAAVGSAASQLAGKAMGVVDHFSWSAVGKSALTAGLTAGLGGGLNALGNVQGFSFAKTAATALSTNATGFGVNALKTYAIQGVANYGVGYVSNRLMGEGQSFSWAGVAASVAGSAAGGVLGEVKLGNTLDKNLWSNLSVGGVLRGQAGAAASAAMNDKWFGGNKPNYGMVAADALGNTIGGAIKNRMMPPVAPKPLLAMYTDPRVQAQRAGDMIDGLLDDFSPRQPIELNLSVDGMSAADLGIPSLPNNLSVLDYQYPRFYKVKAGDTQSSIAKNFLGNANLWPSFGKSGDAVLRIGETIGIPNSINEKSALNEAKVYYAKKDAEEKLKIAQARSEASGNSSYLMSALGASQTGVLDNFNMTLIDASGKIGLNSAYFTQSRLPPAGIAAPLSRYESSLMTPMGQIEAGINQGVRNLAKLPLTLGQGIFNLAADAVGAPTYAALNAMSGNDIDYQPMSGMVQAVQKDGILLASAHGVRNTVAGVVAPLDALNRRDWTGVGESATYLAVPFMFKRVDVADIPAPTVSIFGFRGAGSTKDLLAADPPHPYVVTGHVGYSFDSGATIYGFGPKVADGMSAYDAVQSLRNGTSYPGIITDDTAVFQSVANNPAMGRGGVPQAVIEQKIPVSLAEFDAIKAAHDGIGVNNPMDNVLYGFPGQNACTFNCATFPTQLGIRIPEASGNMRSYMPLLEKLGQPWKPK